MHSPTACAGSRVVVAVYGDKDRLARHPRDGLTGRENKAIRELGINAWDKSIGLYISIYMTFMEQNK